MQRRERGYHQVVVENIEPGTRYVYRFTDGREFPDPASCHQPHGVHGASAVVADDFEWHDQHWFGLPIERYVIYETHIGAFSEDGTFQAAAARVDELVDLGITALELMPVAQFPGARNWGYDGAFPFAPQNSYGGPLGLKILVDACHKRNVAVILDVVYNHIGPEGNHLAEFGPYFTDRYKTPWGRALNFDDAASDEVRAFFIENALYWIGDYHIDALRLDAVHAILDHSAYNFLEELNDEVHKTGTQLNRRVYSIAESALNDTRVIRPTELGGYGLDAQWNDDFHHSLHTLLTGEREGYYVDFGDFQHMAQAFSEGFVYAGRYSVTRGRRHGNSSREIPPEKFVVYAQNHDQIGNRMSGERLGRLVTFESVKLAAAVVLLSPFIPLLFMGDEYGETAPFQYFVSHSDPGLVDAVRAGRREEFSHFKWAGEPPDPQDEQTFHRSRLRRSLDLEERQQALLDFHKELIRLRKRVPALIQLSKTEMDVSSFEREKVLAVRRWHGENEVLIIFNFNNDPVRMPGPFPHGLWHKRLDSEDDRWLGAGGSAPPVMESRTGAPFEVRSKAVVVFEKETEL